MMEPQPKSVLQAYQPGTLQYKVGQPLCHTEVPLESQSLAFEH